MTAVWGPGITLERRPKKDDSRLGRPHPTDHSLSPKTGSSASGAAFRSCAAAFGLPSGRKRAFEKPIPARGVVRVAASTVIAQYQLLPSLDGLRRRHPLLRVELEVSDRLADLAREGIDIAIRTGSELPDTVVARPLGHLGRALYAAPGYLAQAGVPAHPDDLAQHQLVTNSAAAHLNHWPFMINGQPVKRAVQGDWRCNDTGLAAGMVLQGLGIGRLATVATEALVQAGRLVPVLAAWVDRDPAPLHAVMASTRQRLPKIRACVDYWVDWFSGRGAITAP